MRTFSFSNDQSVQIEQAGHHNITTVHYYATQSDERKKEALRKQQEADALKKLIEAQYNLILFYQTQYDPPRSEGP